MSKANGEGKLSKFEWKRAFDAAAIPQNYSARAIVLASRLADHCNLRTGRCDPRQDVLAKGMGVNERTVRRAVKELKDAGWITSKRGGRDDSVSFTLVIPDSMLSGMDNVTTPSQACVTSPGTRGSYRTETASIPDTQAVLSNEQGTRIGAPTARQTVREDRIPVTTDTDDDDGIPMYDDEELAAMKSARIARSAP